MATKNTYFWTKQQADGTTQVGLNDQGRDDLGEVSFIDLPAAGTELEVGGKFISVEAEKAVTDLESPVAGTIVAVNEKLADQPEDLSSSEVTSLEVKTLRFLSRNFGVFLPPVILQLGLEPVSCYTNGSRKSV